MNFIAICYVCLIVLPNFNHHMYACTWFAADKPFIKRRCYVMLTSSEVCYNKCVRRLDHYKPEASDQWRRQTPRSATTSTCVSATWRHRYTSLSLRHHFWRSSSSQLAWFCALFTSSVAGITWLPVTSAELVMTPSFRAASTITSRDSATTSAASAFTRPRRLIYWSWKRRREDSGCWSRQVRSRWWWWCFPAASFCLSAEELKVKS